MTSRRPIVLDDLAALRWAMEPAVHPTEALVAFVVSGLDPASDHLGYELHMCEPGVEPRLLASRARKPRWSHRGDRIAFTREEQGRWLPASMTLEGEESALEAPPGDAVDVRWAPDGNRLLVVATVARSPHEAEVPYRVASSADWVSTIGHAAWIVETGQEPLRVAEDLRNVFIADWSPDGDRVALVSDEGVDRDASIATGIWLWSVASGESEPLVPSTRPIQTLAWAPDGSAIAFLTAARDNANSARHELWVVDVGTGDHHRLGSGLDRSLGKPIRGDDERAIGAPILVWDSDSTSVLAIYADGGFSRLGRFHLDGNHEVVDVGHGVVLELDTGGAGLAFSWSDPVTPGEISWVDLAGDTTQLTRVGDPLLSALDLAATTRVSAVASDGVEVEGWVTLPADPEGAPLVLQVHGGPHYAVGERFSFDAQRLAARGIAVLRANPRGSHGYGQAFAEGNLGDWGGRDLADLLDLVDEAVRQSGLDGERVAIVGESYGGFMSIWAVGTTDRFVAAVVESGIADLLSSAGGSVGTTFWHSELGVAPWDDPSIYVERSPITRLDEVNVPVLIIHCEGDATCPIAQGEALFSGLRELGADVEFWRVPGEGHFINVFGALSRRLGRIAAIDEFLVGKLGTHSPATRSEREEIRS